MSPFIQSSGVELNSICLQGESSQDWAGTQGRFLGEWWTHSLSQQECGLCRCVCSSKLVHQSAFMGKREREPVSCDKPFWHIQLLGNLLTGFLWTAWDGDLSVVPRGTVLDPIEHWMFQVVSWVQFVSLHSKGESKAETSERLGQSPPEDAGVQAA